MSSSFYESLAAPVHPDSLGQDSSILGTEESQVSDYPSSTPIYVSGEGLSPDQPELSSFQSEGSVLPPPSEMQPEEGFALREWRRWNHSKIAKRGPDKQNALRLEEKERIEKELLNQILDEADEYKINFHNKRKMICDSNIATNRENEKVYVAGRDRFHAEADKSYWKAIAELIPKEVPVIETRGAKKDQDKKPSVVMIQGPKPGKPTDLLRMRQILIKLKHDTPLHLKHSPPPPTAKDAGTAAATTAEAVAVA